METGFVIVSETALNAENAKLRVVEPFTLTSEPYPTSEATLAEAEKQALERDMWLGQKFRLTEKLHVFNHSTGSVARFDYSEIPTSEEEYRSQFRHPHGLNPAEYSELVRLREFLSAIRSGGEVTLLTDFKNDSGEDLRGAAGQITFQRRPDLNDTFDFGIPKSNVPGWGLLIAQAFADHAKQFTKFPNFHDERYPQKCEDGHLSIDLEKPGILFWEHDYGCRHRDTFKSFTLPGVG